MKEPLRKFQGVWIPKALWIRRDLTWFEKCLLTEISSLCDPSGGEFCYASNAYLAEMMGTSEQTIQNAISKFRGMKLIIDWGERGKQRQISVASTISADQIAVEHQTQGFTGTKPRGLPAPNPGVYIDTSRDTKGEKEESEGKPRTPDEDLAVKNEFSLFTAWWIPAIQKLNPRYRFDGKEGQHLKLLLKHSTAEELRLLVEAVWKSKGFYSEKLRSISFLNGQFNSITAEIKPPKPKLNGHTPPVGLSKNDFNLRDDAFAQRVNSLPFE